MNIDLNKTLGYDMASRAGIDALHKTLAAATGADVGEKIADDLTALSSQAINTLLKDPAKPGATLPMAQLVGYLGELSALFGKLSAGHRFEVTRDRLGDTAVTVKKIQPRSTK